MVARVTQHSTEATRDFAISERSGTVDEPSAEPTANLRREAREAGEGAKLP